MYGKKEKEATVCSSENHIDYSFSYGLIVIIVYTNPMCGIVSCFKVAAAASKLDSWRDGKLPVCIHGTALIGHHPATRIPAQINSRTIVSAVVIL